jgi:hypothetical protein
LPGAPSFRQYLVHGFDAQENAAAPMLQYLGDHQSAICRPPFVPIAPVRPWVPAEATIPGKDEKTVNAIISVAQQIQAKEAQLRTLETGEPPSGVPGPAAPAPGLSHSFGPGRPITLPRPVPPPPAPGPAGPATVESLKKDLENLSSQWLELVPPPHGLKPDEPPAPTHLVAYDLTVKPGQTYRYRVQVAMLNPYFLKAQLPDKERRIYFKVLGLVSNPGAWSDPVAITQRSQFFLSRVDPQSATFVVRYIHAGIWQMTTATVRRGHPVVGEVNIDGEVTTLRSGEVLVDVVPDTKSVVLRDPANRMRSLMVDDDQENLNRFAALAGLGVPSSPARP